MKAIFHTLFVCFLLAASSSLFAAKLPSANEPVMPATAPSLPLALAPQSSAPSFADALKQFKSLSRSERKDRINAAKSELKQFKQDQKEGKAATTNTLLLVIIAIILPPLAVYLHEDAFNSKFWLSLLLTLLFYVPGLIYALVVILGKD